MTSVKFRQALFHGFEWVSPCYSPAVRISRPPPSPQASPSVPHSHPPTLSPSLPPSLSLSISLSTEVYPRDERVGH